MEEKIFMDKLGNPTERALQDALGDAYEQYKKIIEITSGYKKKWIFTKSGGWMLKAFDAKKALFYIIPLKNELKISMAIRENERDLFLKEECIHIYHDRLLSAKKFTEGYAVQFMIADEFDFTGVESLLRILMSLRS